MEAEQANRAFCQRALSGSSVETQTPQGPRGPWKAGDSSRAGKALVSIVVPTYREADNLSLLVPRITAALETGRTRSSSSTTIATMVRIRSVATLSEQGHAIRLIVRTDQRGLSSAVLRGFC